MFTPQKAPSTNPETYTIAAGTSLYRGDTPFYIANKDSNAVLREVPTFFGLAKDDVAQYGIIHAWTATKDINLLHLDNPDVMKGIYDAAPKDVQTVLRVNYGYQPDSNTIGHSNSIFEKDKIFYEYLCTTGSPGYASTRSEGEEESAYEIMVCNPGPDSFRFEDIVFPSGTGDKTLYIERETKKYTDRIKPKAEMVGKKKKLESVFDFGSSMALADSPPAKMMAFADSPEYKPLRSPFGKSPIKSSFGTPARKGRALFVDDEPRGGVNTPEQKTSRNLFGTPGGSKKRKLNKKRKTKRGKRISRSK
jgi:hypothetical protein